MLLEVLSWRSSWLCLYQYFKVVSGGGGNISHLFCNRLEFHCRCGNRAIAKAQYCKTQRTLYKTVNHVRSSNMSRPNCFTIHPGFKPQEGGCGHLFGNHKFPWQGKMYRVAPWFMRVMNQHTRL